MRSSIFVHSDNDRINRKNERSDDVPADDGGRCVCVCVLFAGALPATRCRKRTTNNNDDDDSISSVMIEIKDGIAIW